MTTNQTKRLYLFVFELDILTRFIVSKMLHLHQMTANALIPLQGQLSALNCSQSDSRKSLLKQSANIIVPISEQVAATTAHSMAANQRK